MRRYLILSAVVLLGVLIASPPLANADNPVVFSDGDHDLMNAAGKLAPSQFYLDFVDIIEEGTLLLDNGYYVFGMVLLDTPDEWLTESWVPAFTGSPVHIERVRYQWNLFDSAFNMVGAIRIIFRADLGGIIRVNAMVCVPAVPDLPDQSMAECGPESYVTNPLTLEWYFDASTYHSLSLYISVEEFGSLFQNAVYWRAQACAFLTTMGVAGIRDNARRALLPSDPEP